MAVGLGGDMGGGGGMAKSKIMAKVKYDFSTKTVGTSVIPLFRVISIGRSISYIIFMIQGHLECQKVNLIVK